SSIGKKKLVGLTGLLISLFTLSHMAGNLLMFVGPDAYNTYSHKLVTNPAIYLAEAGLVAFFLIHIALTVQLTRANRAARPVGYAGSASGVKKTSFAAKTAILSGALLLAFVVLHLQTFKFGEVYTTTVDGVEMRDIYRLVVEKFHQPGYRDVSGPHSLTPHITASKAQRPPRSSHTSASCYFFGLGG
ncbi:hypothetical protein EBZ37_09400, partial [bacterium]|nr:hypothetical protein [bacterium]